METTIGVVYDDALFYWRLNSDQNKALTPEEEKDFERQAKIAAKRKGFVHTHICHILIDSRCHFAGARTADIPAALSYVIMCRL